MNTARIYGAVALLLLLSVVVGGVALHFLGNGANVSSESQNSALDKQALLDGLAEGRILYLMIEDYQDDRIIPGTADPPKLVLIEMWWRPETGQHGALSLVTEREYRWPVAPTHVDDKRENDNHVCIQRRDVGDEPRSGPADGDRSERQSAICAKVRRSELGMAAELGISTGC